MVKKAKNKQPKQPDDAPVDNLDLKAAVAKATVKDLVANGVPTPAAKAQAAARANDVAPSTVDQFKAAIRLIRDLLRTDGITGKDSFTHIALFLTARFMTDERAAALKMDPKCSWNAIMAVYDDTDGTYRKNDNRLQVLVERFKYNVVDAFDMVLKTQKFPFDVTNSTTVERIVEILNPLDFSKLTHEFDILGYLWEIHLETGAAKARDLGQFFTDRRVAMYMTRLCAPGFVDVGENIQRPERICDPTMGTGGFLTNVLRYYREVYPDRPVDWSKHSTCVQGCDIDGVIAAIARISLLLDSDGTAFPQLLTQDSLRQGLPEPAYEVILANMPFGVKNITYASCCEPIKELRISGTKSEPLFLQLMMQRLAPGGRCAVVVPDGVLSGSAKIHRETRAHLMRHFELLRVITLKGKIFVGTGVQTSVLFFRRPLAAPAEGVAATTQVPFWTLEKEAAGTLAETEVRTVPLADIEAAAWSLEPRQYEPRPEQPAAMGGHPTVALEELCTHRNGKNIPKEKRKEEGTYPYYGTNGITGYVESFLIDGSAILVGDQGSPASKTLRYVEGEKFYPSNHTQVIRANDRINEKFLYYQLRFMDLSPYQRTTSIILELDLKSFYQLRIPVPPLELQQQIVDSLDRIYNPGGIDIIRDTQAIAGAMQLMLNDPTGQQLAAIVETQRLAKRSASMATDVRASMATDVRASMATFVNAIKAKHRKVPLESVCTHRNGKNIPKEKRKEQGEIPYYGSNGINGFVDSFLIDGSAILVGDQGSAWTRSTQYVQGGKFYPSNHTQVIRANAEIDEKFLFFNLKFGDFAMYQRTTTLIPEMDQKRFYQQPIPLPTLEEQREYLDHLEALDAAARSLEDLKSRMEFQARLTMEAHLNPHRGE